jgi:hypothetical protein
MENFPAGCRSGSYIVESVIDEKQFAAMLIVDAILSKKSRRGFLRLIYLSKGYACSWEGGGLKLIEGAIG